MWHTNAQIFNNIISWESDVENDFLLNCTDQVGNDVGNGNGDMCNLCIELRMCVCANAFVIHQL